MRSAAALSSEQAFAANRNDGLTKLERAQIEQGREAYLTGGAKLRYKRLTGQI